jgi:hypothetical protein
MSITVTTEYIPNESIAHYQLRETYMNPESGFSVTLSIVAGPTLYCAPRTDLSSLFNHTHVECAIADNTAKAICVHPRMVGIYSRKIAAMFDSSYAAMVKQNKQNINTTWSPWKGIPATTVAPYLTWDKVNDLRIAIQHAVENQ